MRRPTALRPLLCIFLLLTFDVEAWEDCTPGSVNSTGPFGADPQFANFTHQGSQIFSLFPETDKQLPLVIFMHGSTGEWGMYRYNLLRYASHGMVVLFPFIKDPAYDKNWYATNTDGEYMIRALSFAKDANADKASPLYNKIDLDNVALVRSTSVMCEISLVYRLGTAWGQRAASWRATVIEGSAT